MADVFRTKYVELDESKQTEIDNIKDLAGTLYAMIEARPCRESSIAKTKLEEAVMWAVKGITGY